MDGKMVRGINGLGGSANTPSTIDQRAQKPTGAPTAASTPESSKGAEADNVQLSTQAKSLQSLADKVNELPDVNIERAEKIKAALANGEYQINDLVLADNILNSEALLNG
jgi:negative regulator of flagellin synthesis FlgM